MGPGTVSGLLFLPFPFVDSKGGHLKTGQRSPGGSGRGSGQEQKLQRKKYRLEIL